MKLYILTGAMLLLMAGITLAGNSLEVTGQSALEEAQDILGISGNTTANAAENVTANPTEEKLKKYEGFSNKMINSF